MGPNEEVVPSIALLVPNPKATSVMGGEAGPRSHGPMEIFTKALLQIPNEVFQSDDFTPAAWALEVNEMVRIIGSS